MTPGEAAVPDTVKQALPFEYVPFDDAPFEDLTVAELGVPELESRLESGELGAQDAVGIGISVSW